MVVVVIIVIAILLVVIVIIVIAIVIGIGIVIVSVIVAIGVIPIISGGESVGLMTRSRNRSTRRRKQHRQHGLANAP